MNGRQQIEAAAAGGQPAQQWELISPTGKVEVWQEYRRTDGAYFVEVHFGLDGRVRSARISVPSVSGRWTAISGQRAGKAEQVVAWLNEPERFLAPPPLDPIERHRQTTAAILDAVEQLTKAETCG